MKNKILILFILIFIFLSNIAIANINEDLTRYFKLDETSGTTAHDYTENDDGTANNERVFTSETTGIINTCADFTQGNDHITNFGNSDTLLANDFTLSFWFKLNSLPAVGDNANIFFSGRDTDATYGRTSSTLAILKYEPLGFSNHALYWGYYDGANRRLTLIDDFSDTTNWYHIVITHKISNKTFEITINGERTAGVQYSTGLTYSTAPAIFGGDIRQSKYYDGYIDEIGYWDIVLTPEDIEILYNEGNAQQPPFEEPTPEFLLTAQNAYTNASITNFNASITNATGTTNIETTNGTIYWNRDDTADITVTALNYFPRTYMDHDTDNNLLANLEPAYFEIQAKGNRSNAEIITFSASLTTPTRQQNKTTTNGSIFFDFEKNTAHDLKIFSTDYAILEKTINNINGSAPYTFYLQENNSILVNIYDGITFDKLDGQTFLIDIDGQNTSYFSTQTTSNGTLYLNFLDADTYSFTFRNDNYAEQQYFVTLQDNEYKELDAFLLNKSFIADVTVKVIDPYAIAIEGAVLTMQQLISGSWQTIGQSTTDATGSSLFFLRIGTNYRVLISKTNYITQQATITPTTNPYTVTLQLSPFTLYNHTIPLSCIDSFNIMPPAGYLAPTIHNFTLSVASSNGQLTHFGVYFNDTLISNVTGSPSGGITSTEVNLNETTGSFQVSYFFKCSGNPVYIQTVNYFTSEDTFKNHSIAEVLGGATNRTNIIQRLAIILGVLFVALLISFELGLPVQAYPFITLGTLIIFTLPNVGWIPPLLTTFVGLLVVIPTFVSWRGGQFG